MKKKDRKYVQEAIENEGFHYAFTCWSEFEEVADPEFQRLRSNYVQASQDLADYVGAYSN